MAEKFPSQCKRFDIKLDCTEYKRYELKNGDVTTRNNPGYLFLNECNDQIIVAEVKLGNHLWCVNGWVHKARKPSNKSTNFYTIGLFVYVEPDLKDEESSTLKVSYTHSDETCNFETFEIVPPKNEFNEYGPYEIKIEIPPVAGIIYYGKLTLTLGIGKLSDINCVSFAEKQPNPTSVNSFLEYSNQLFQNHELSDVTLKIRGKEVPAHKLLLSSASPVFKAMFLNDFRECRSNVIEIKDFEFDVIREMLKFIYTLKTPQFRTPKGNVDTASLYKAAHKYEIQYLLESCRQELLSTFNIESALDVLLLADIYDDALLKEKVLDFICRNPSAADDVSKCEEVVRKRPGLLKDILTCKYKQK